MIKVITYDAANRLRAAIYGEDDPSTKECDLEKTDKYSVPNIVYDDLGNIKALLRNGIVDYGPSGSDPEYGPIDLLKYGYQDGSSLLVNMTDGSSHNYGFQGSNASYGYENGNLITDSQKGINKIIYSYNDLPLSIQSDKGYIRNWYTADGQKIKTNVHQTNPAGPTIVTKYLGAAEYINNEIQFISVEEGRVVYPEKGDAYPEYFLKDHLGNVRTRIADKNNDNLVNVDPNNPEEDELMNIRHYYPFGMEWDTPLEDIGGNSLAESELKNKYTYNGKELVSDLGVNLHDYGLRYLDPAIGRWTTIDPRAEKYPGMSPYNYVGNNPIKNIDIMGDTITPVGFETDIVSAQQDQSTQTQFVDPSIPSSSDVSSSGGGFLNWLASFLPGDHIGTGTVFTSENAIPSDQVEKTADKIDGEANIDGLLSISGPGNKGTMLGRTVTTATGDAETIIMAGGMIASTVDKTVTAIGKVKKVKEISRNKSKSQADSLGTVRKEANGQTVTTYHVRKKKN